jgi:formate-dependent nitrite reductase membrane component NrfD
MSARRQWLVDGLVGIAIGGLVGAIVAVNIVIYAGIEQGYEASIPDVFRQNALVGVLTVGTLIAGPVVGVLVMRRRRRRGENVE